jgi:L-alanine-DL-glutamate epimerase-like enolase superfamily enzyme
MRALPFPPIPAVSIFAKRTALSTKAALGFDAFKVKFGFGLASDISSVKHVFTVPGANEGLFADANQA